MSEILILFLILFLITISNYEYFYDLLASSKTIQCLTDKPYNPEYSSNLYFRNRIQNMKKEYATCNKYRCRTERLNGYTANGIKSELLDHQTLLNHDPTLKGTQTINPEYYHDPEKFCKLNPSSFPCPNFWIKGDKFYKPGKQPFHVKTFCEENNQHELELCGVNDNQSTTIIPKGKEDQGLCANQTFTNLEY